jgi:hypothetical protein
MVSLRRVSFLGFLVLAHTWIAFAVKEISFRHVVVDDRNPTNPHCKAVGDMNGDGWPDILAASSTGNTDGLFWYEYPSWTKHRITPGSFSTDMQVADVDGDGDLDAIIPKGINTGDSVWWYENPRPKGKPATDAWREHKIGDAHAHDLEVGDLNRDRKIDVVVREGATTLFLQKSPDSWTKVTIPTGGRGGTALGDIDRDGRLDLVQNGYWLQAPADPERGMWLRHDFATGGSSSSAWPGDVGVAVADLSGDRRPDLLIAPAESPGRLCWYEAPRDPRGGAWKEHVIDPNVSHIHTFKLADMDSDGRLDVVTAEMHQSPQRRVGVYFNEGGGLKWRQQVVATTGSHNLRVGDIDRDGDTDIVGANWNNASPTWGAIELWRNDLRSPRGRVHLLRSGGA